ncbi:MAG: ABC transporter permease [Lachnospiraceae bacterium]|nr:ABC transporter permease [Lachnospiraceae bacterium]
MNKLRKAFSFSRLLFLLLCSVFLIITFILNNIASAIIEKQDTQQAATRWKKEGGAAQISCFFSVNTKLTPESIEDFEHNLDSALEAASIVLESPHANARLWADAYSASGKIAIKSNIGKIDVDAIGIGGDFFLFHPLPLLSGSYFSGNDIMQDYCVLDQDAAWKLFGSNNVVGQTVYIGEVAHIVTGVVKRDESKLYKAAGLDSALIYVSYSTLEKYGSNNGINHFEIVMPNPVKGYAYDYVKKAIGVAEEELEIVENSKRFTFFNRIKHIAKLQNRAMNGKAIIYPYWENVARVTEDKLARLMILQLLFTAISVIVISISLFILWKNKKCTVKSVLIRLKEWMELKIIKRNQQRMYEKQKKQRKA